MAQELAENHNSNNSLTSCGPTRSTATDIAKLLARCLSNYGERKGGDMRLLAAEWHTTLGAYPADRLHAALSDHIRRSTWWPTVANLVEILRDATPPPGLPRHQALDVSFERDGRTQVEEAAHRAEQCRKWREAYGMDPGTEAPASDDLGGV
jgi:hypothetical protein